MKLSKNIRSLTCFSEEQARAILRNDKDAKKQCSGEIFNSEGPMEYHQANGQLSVTFRNMVRDVYTCGAYS